LKKPFAKVKVVVFVDLVEGIIKRIMVEMEEMIGRRRVVVVENLLKGKVMVIVVVVVVVVVV